MKTTFRFLAATSLVLTSAAHAAVEPPSLKGAGDVDWEFPRNGNCHEGMPFSDGRAGVLVWGGEGALNLTLGRSDLWDHRGGYAWTDEQNYTNIVALWTAKREKELLGMFRNTPPPNWGGRYNPYMLPLGRVVVTYDRGWHLRAGSLDTHTGLGDLLFERLNSFPGRSNEVVRAELAMCKWGGGLFAIRFPKEIAIDAEIVPSMKAPAVRSALAPRGFADAVVRKGPNAGLFGARGGSSVWQLPAEPERPAVIRWWIADNTLFVRTDRAEPFVWGGAVPTFDTVRDAAKRHWARFWREGARIRVPDPLIQRLYDYGMYRFGAMTDPDGVPAGLQGPWLEDDQLVPWNGDYHFNINVQECYAPAYRGGHFANLRPLFRMILSWRPLLRENARKFVGIDNGYVLPHSVDDRGVCIGGFWSGTIDHGSAVWVAAMMMRYVRYSGDIAFLKEGAYDFMKGAMNVSRALMEERGGRLSIPLAPSPEWGGADFLESVGRDPSFQLAAAHRLARDLLEAARLLGEAPDPMWQDVDKRLPPYVRDAATGVCLFEGRPLTESHRHHSHLAGYFPFDTIPARGKEGFALLEWSLHNWTKRGTGNWTGWCVPWAAVLNVHAGYAVRAVGLLHDWDAYFCDEGHGSHHNAVRFGFTSFAWGRGVMQMDGQCAAAAAVLELLAHEVGGKTEFFKGCPHEWKDVSFENLALSDGRRVSGRRLNGAVQIDGELLIDGVRPTD